MLNELLAADLLVMTMLLAHLSWHCFKWNKERPEIFDRMTIKTTELFDILTEGGAILEDMADLLDRPSAGAVEKATGSLGVSIPELLLNSLISRSPISENHGESEERTIQEEIPKENEQN